MDVVWLVNALSFMSGGMALYQDWEHDRHKIYLHKHTGHSIHTPIAVHFHLQLLVLQCLVWVIVHHIYNCLFIMIPLPHLPTHTLCSVGPCTCAGYLCNVLAALDQSPTQQLRDVESLLQAEKER